VSLTGARWQRVNELFHAALAHAANERDAFVARECGADSQLRLEVESLLAAHITQASVAGSAISTGTRLGDYEVTSFIAAGAMGQVYRARDTKLGREVALKILPPAFVSDRDRRARFEREARVLASLNHPNIATIYGFVEAHAISALALELVEGETLSERIARGKLPIDEALEIAKQIAEALEAAHDRGIVHRDLKPANVKLTRDGAVKVLDFGLAKIAESTTVGQSSAAAAVEQLSMSPTITSPAMMTGAGILLGTAAYMAPEQAKGRAADRRSDIWAFGCVLFEMLAGKAPFPGEDVGDTLASILKTDARWSALPSTIPLSLGDVPGVILSRSVGRKGQAAIEPAAWPGSTALASGRRSGRAEDDEPVALRDRREPLKLGRRSRRGRRQHARGRRVTDFAHESLELHRREAHERPRRVGSRADECVRHALRTEREPARRQIHPRVADIDREVPLEHIEPFVLFGVDMPRGTEPGRDDDLEQAEPSPGVRPADLHRLQHAEEPERLAFVVRQRVAT
jgi:tRNA A-37 threonylcarbamoyl transferase component Bud32